MHLTSVTSAPPFFGSFWTWSPRRCSSDSSSSSSSCMPSVSLSVLTFNKNTNEASASSAYRAEGSGRIFCLWSLLLMGPCFCWITGTNWHPECILEDDDEGEEHHLGDQVQNEPKKTAVAEIAESSVLNARLKQGSVGWSRCHRCIQMSDESRVFGWDVARTLLLNLGLALL